MKASMMMALSAMALILALPAAADSTERKVELVLLGQQSDNVFVTQAFSLSVGAGAEVSVGKMIAKDGSVATFASASAVAAESGGNSRTPGRYETQICMTPDCDQTDRQ